jgi:hypothetical protein
MALKHIGRSVKQKKRCAVAYRVIPGDPNFSLVVFSENLDAPDHDSLMKLLESDAGQNANELADAMHRTQLADGQNMLLGFHRMGKLTKVLSEDIEMTPDTKSTVNLAELNKIIAEQKGVTVGDLANEINGASPVAQTAPVEDTTNISRSETDAPAGVLSDEELAAQYRSQADAMFKEAKRLREQAEELVPTKRKTKASVEEAQ